MTSIFLDVKYNCHITYASFDFRIFFQVFGSLIWELLFFIIHFDAVYKISSKITLKQQTTNLNRPRQTWKYQMFSQQIQDYIIVSYDNQLNPNIIDIIFVQILCGQRQRFQESFHYGILQLQSAEQHFRVYLGQL